MHVLASNSSVPTLEIFAGPQARKNACWGAPQTRRTSGQSVPKSRRYAPVVCGLSLPLLGLIFPPVRHAEQMVNVRLDCHGLPHIGLGLAILGIEGLFLFRQLPAVIFSACLFWGALPRPGFHSWPPLPPDKRPAPPHAGPGIFDCTGPPCSHRTQAGSWHSPPWPP